MDINVCTDFESLGVEELLIYPDAWCFSTCSDGR